MAYVVRQLRSGDLEVAVPNQKTKDQTLNHRKSTAAKTSVKTIQLKFPACLSLWISRTERARKMSRPSGTSVKQTRMMPHIAINRTRWLHNDKAQEERRKNGKTREAVIISFPTQAVQYEAK
jgi:hypothetical protein